MYQGQSQEVFRDFLFFLPYQQFKRLKVSHQTIRQLSWRSEAIRRRKQFDTIKGTADEHAHVNNGKYSSIGTTNSD